MVETLLSIGHEVELVSLIHKPGNIVGPLHSHKTTSSYLSLFFKKKSSLERFPNWTKSAAKKFKIPKADFYLFLSTGFFHLVETDPKIPRVDYLYGEASRFNNLKNTQKINVCSQSLGNTLELEEVNVIPAPFISRDFPVMGKYYENKNVLLRTENMDRVQLYKVISLLGADYQLKVISKSKQVHELKTEFPQIEFFGELNSNALYIELLKSLVFIDDCDHAFPVETFCSLCTGIPVIVKENQVNSEFLVGDICSFYRDYDDFKSKLSDFLGGETNFKPDLLRRYALRFNERIFKNRFLRLINIQKKSYRL